MIRRLLATLLLTAGTLSYAQVQTINVGSAANDGTGDSGRSAFQKVNSNFVNIGGAHYVACTNGSSGAVDAALLATAAALGGNIILTGNCTVNATTTLISNTTFYGNGYTITNALAANWSASTVRAALSAANSAVNVKIIGGRYDYTGTAGTVHILSFPSANVGFEVSGVTCLGSGDCVAMTGASYGQVHDSIATDSLNACWDAWGGSNRISIHNNHCTLTTTAANAYCVLVTGLNTDLTSAHTDYIDVHDNICDLQGQAVTGQLGVWIEGHASSGSVSHGTIHDEHFNVASGKWAEPIRGTGIIDDWDIHDNIIVSDGVTTSSLPAIEINGSGPTRIFIHDNHATNWLGQTAGNDRGVYKNGGTGGSLINNSCSGTCSTPIDYVGGAGTPQQMGDSSAGNAAYTVTSPTTFVSTITSPNSAFTVFDVKAYGAVCNGTTNDSAAWQSAWNALIAYSYVATTHLAAKLVGCGSGQSLITTTLDFTNLSSFAQPHGMGVTVDMAGTCLLGQTSGTPVVDAVHSRYISWEHLCIYGSQTNTPNVGLLLGRAQDAHSADTHYFNRPVITGYFTLAAWLNAGAEDLVAMEPIIWNAKASGTVYAMIQDGANHFNICTLTVASGCTTSVDTNSSFGNNVFIGGWIGGTASNGTPLWMGSAQHHQFIGGYMSTVGANCVVLYNESTDGVFDLHFDLHCETTAIADTFLVSGTNLTPTFINLYIDDRAASATNSMLKFDTGIVSATCNGCTVNVPWFTSGSGVKVFDDATKWNYSGKIYVPASTNYTTPNKFSGEICVGNVCDGYKNPGASLTNTAAGNGALANAANTLLNSTAFGSQACALTATGNQCVAFGANAGSVATATAAVAAFGFDAAQFVSTGVSNTAIGNLAMTGISGTKITGASNTAIGYGAGTALQGTGNANTLVGATAGTAITTGGSNTCIGNAVCSSVLLTGAGSIYIGVSNNPAATNTSNVLQIAGLSPGIATIAATNINTAAPLLAMPAEVRTGTKFTAAGTGACGTITTTLGGASAGSFLCTGTAGASTATITIAGATGNTATTGWVCTASDATSGVAWATSGNASTTTATIAGTIATTSDRVVFSCTGY